MPVSDLLQALDRDLREIFGARLQSLSVYGEAHAPRAADHDAAHGHDAVSAAHARKSAALSASTIAIVRTAVRGSCPCA